VVRGSSNRRWDRRGGAHHGPRARLSPAPPAGIVPPMRTLVTGAGGFVGGFMIDNLLAAGHEVVACSNREFDPPGEVAAEVFDIRQAARVAEAFDRHPPDAVIHLAGQASVSKSWKDPGLTFRVNLIGSANVLEALRSFPQARVLLVGSAQVYGRAQSERPISEDRPADPVSPYGISRVAQEMLGRAYFKELGRPVISTRSFNHTGPGQSSEYAVGSFCAQVAELERKGGGTMKVGNLDAVRDFLDVRDVAEAYRLLVERGEPGEIYNVCSGEGRRLGDLLKIVLDAAKISGSVEVVEEAAPRKGDPAMLIGDNSKLRAATGWAPRISLEQSLADTLDWYRSQRKD
jgi:GDP-4-dehydro-6-deoxy-D-mannose reductase